MSSDLELKQQDIENDFYKCLARLKNVKIILNSISLETIDKSQQEEILVDLGRVGELAFKYLLKLKQLELYPNQTYEQFGHSQTIFKINTLKDLKNKNIISESDLEELKNFTDETSQPFHNYSYLSMILEKILPDVYINFKKYIEYKEQSKELIKLLDFNNEWDRTYVTHVIFPELVWTGSLEIPEEKIKEVMKTMAEVEKNTGDIFTRLRYFYNNQSQKEFNLEEIYKYIEALVEFIIGIHDNYNLLNTNPTMIFGKREAKKHAKLLQRTNEEIDSIFREFINEDPIEIDNILGAPNYSLEEMINIRKYCKEQNLLYFEAISNNLTLEEIKYFINYNIYDFTIMIQVLRREDNKKRSLEEVELLLKEIEYDKYDNLCLIGILSIDEIKELNKHKELETFIIEHYYEVLYDMLFIYKPPFDFIELLKIKEIVENPQALYSLDNSQLSIYNKFIEYFKSDEKYRHLFDEKPLNIYKNIEINLKTFMNCPELLYSIPLMLDPEEINSILVLLMLEGLDITKLDNFNSTILCMPSNFVYATYSILKEKNISLIKDNNVCNEFFECSNQLLKSIHKKIRKDIRFYEPFRSRSSDSVGLKKQHLDKIRK